MAYTSDMLKDFIAKRASRRRFMGRAGIASLGALGLAQLSGVEKDAVAQTSPEITDFNILNFALNLEYLEAEYYLRAIGRRLDFSDTTGVGRRGGVTGGSEVPFATDIIRQYAEEIAADEEAHVKFLRMALGGAKVARPSINLSTSFTNAAIAAGIIMPGQVFDPFADENSFLLGAFVFEDVGVTAYKGAARFIENKDYLEAAAGILAVEAYHAGEIRTLLLARGLSDPAGKISDLRDAADGPMDLDQGIIDESGKANIVPTDANGLAFSRNTNQVLSIVYLGGRAGAYGFFPRRLNGAIR